MSVRGLAALHATNPMTLYVAARYRTASEELDYVYGVIQIFGLRLGNANPELKKPLKFSLPDLKEQLGEALMKISPVWSQSHVHTVAPREFGKGWRVSRSLTTPGHGYERRVPWQLYQEENPACACQMTTKLLQGVRWGFFSGKACSFLALQKVWASMYEVRATRKGLYAVISWKESDHYMQIALDFAPDIFPHLQSHGEYQIQDAHGPHKLAAWMADKFDPRQLQILHMATFNGAVKYPIHFGLSYCYTDHETRSITGKGWESARGRLIRVSYVVCD